MSRELFQGKCKKSHKTLTGPARKDTKYPEHNQKSILKLLDDASAEKTKLRGFDEDMRERYRV